MKKRRVWWIVGASVAFIAIAGVFIPGLSEQKLEQNLLQVASDFGFSQIDIPFEGELIGGPYLIHTLLEASMSEAEVRDLVSRMGTVCKGWDAIHVPRNNAWVSATRYEHKWIVEVTHVPATGRARIWITKYESRPGLWERIKGLWPL